MVCRSRCRPTSDSRSVGAAQLREQAVGVVQQVAGFLYEDVDQFRVELAQVQRFVRIVGTGQRLRDERGHGRLLRLDGRNGGEVVRRRVGRQLGQRVLREFLRLGQLVAHVADGGRVDEGVADGCRFQRSGFDRRMLFAGDAIGFGVFGLQARVLGFLVGDARRFQALGFEALGGDAFGFQQLRFDALLFGQRDGGTALGHGGLDGSLMRGFGGEALGALFGCTLFGETLGFGLLGGKTFGLDALGLDAFRFGPCGLFGSGVFGGETLGLDARGFFRRGTLGVRTCGFGQLRGDALGFGGLGGEQFGFATLRFGARIFLALEQRRARLRAAVLPARNAPLPGVRLRCARRWRARSPRARPRCGGLRPARSRCARRGPDRRGSPGRRRRRGR